MYVTAYYSCNIYIYIYIYIYIETYIVVSYMLFMMSYFTGHTCLRNLQCYCYVTLSLHDNVNSS